MTRIVLSLIAAALLMGGCGVRQRLRQEAEITHDAARQMGENSDEANMAKEAKIYADAVSIQQKQHHQELLDSGRQERYEVRREDGKFTIYDRQTGSVAKAGAKAQVGLSESSAYEAYQSLKQSDEYAKSNMAALLAGQRGHN